MTAFRCWEEGCKGYCKVQQYFGLTKFSNLSNPVGLSRVADFTRLYTFAPKIKCAPFGTNPNRKR